MTGAGRPEAILIAGPTASGKSALALALAQAHDGVVINVDSMQVYRDLRVLSARPTVEEEALAPHRLYGDVDGALNHSVGHHLARVGPVLADLRAQRRLPILVGGTGLYFLGLIEGLSEIPAVPGAVRERVRSEAVGLASEVLHAHLAARDPVGAATLRPTDRLRTLRALEVLEATGAPISSFYGRRGKAPLAGLRTLDLFLDAPRETLRTRINARFAAMVETGALDEVAALRDRRLDPMLPVMRAHGVPALIAHCDGAITLAEAVARGQADTRRYAKRQVTFFRHQMARRFAFVAPDAARDMASAALAWS